MKVIAVVTEPNGDIPKYLERVREALSSGVDGVMIYSVNRMTEHFTVQAARQAKLAHPDVPIGIAVANDFTSADRLTQIVIEYQLDFFSCNASDLFCSYSGMKRFREMHPHVNVFAEMDGEFINYARTIAGLATPQIGHAPRFAAEMIAAGLNHHLGDSERELQLSNQLIYGRDSFRAGVMPVEVGVKAVVSLCALAVLRGFTPVLHKDWLDHGIAAELLSATGGRASFSLASDFRLEGEFSEMPGYVFGVSVNHC